MKNPLILTIDVGTQSCRTAIFNKKGELLAIYKARYDDVYTDSKQLATEIDPDYYYNIIIDSIKKLNKKNPELFKDIAGITMDTIRDSAVLLDENYKPLHKCILWMDQRLARGIKKRPLLHRAIFRVIGMAPTIKLNTKKSMSLWLQENLPLIWAKGKHYGNISSYLTYKLTGQFADSPASIIGHYPLDFKKRKFYKSLGNLKNIYNIPYSMLPKLVQPGEVLGEISKEVCKLTGIKEGTKLYSCGSDKSCESLGVGALNPTVAAISYGTASTVEVTTRRYHESEPFLPAYPSCIPDYYNMDVQIYRGYWMINWFVKYFCHYDVSSNDEFVKILKEFNKQMMKVPAGSDGLILQPYWQPGLARPLSKGAVIGFTDTHTGAHFYRSIIEGIGYALREGLEHFEKKTHRKVRSMMISGGGSQSDEICQITANIFNRPVSRVQTFETSSLGAAIAGFLAIGVYKDPKTAVENMVHTSITFNPNDEETKIYDFLFKKGYKKMYSSLTKIYKDINNN